MKKLLVKFSFVLCFGLLSLIASKSNAQIDIMGRLLTGGIDDAEKISQAYLNPFIDGFGANLNAGWYNTAKPHSLFGFDLTVSLNTSIVPSVARSYNLSDLNLDATVIGDDVVPTFSGVPDSDRSHLAYYMEYNGNPVELTKYRVPNGVGLAYIPAPMIQAGIGMPFDTDLIFRYTPEFNLGNTGKIGLYGFGIKHSIKQWIPVFEKLPLINLSIQGGYTKFHTSSGIDIKPVDIDASDRTTDAVNFSDQKFLFDVSSITANLVASVDIPFFVVYGAVGFATNTANLRMLGYYPIPTLDMTDGSRIVTDESVVRKDPIDFVVVGDANKYEPKYNLGLKFKMGLFHLYFDYTYAHYSVATAGMALSFR
ncbi:MAG: hypothetical protein KGZ97_04855 [Bacteroidetes bacterium]|nr:hypothetical protein [Bacteroidota bacterium]